MIAVGPFASAPVALAGARARASRGRATDAAAEPDVTSANVGNMAKKKNKWSKTWVSQTDIGHYYGLYAIKVGRVLTELGLKDKAGATQRAIDDGFAVSAPLADGTQHWRWRKSKVLRAFDEHGIDRVSKQKQAQSRLKKEAAALFRQNNPMLEDGIDKFFWTEVECIREEGNDALADEVEACYRRWADKQV